MRLLTPAWRYATAVFVASLSAAIAAITKFEAECNDDR